MAKAEFDCEKVSTSGVNFLKTTVYIHGIESGIEITNDCGFLQLFSVTLKVLSISCLYLHYEV